jgi:hypothetical protein
LTYQELDKNNPLNTNNEDLDNPFGLVISQPGADSNLKVKIGTSEFIMWKYCANVGFRFTQTITYYLQPIKGMPHWCTNSNNLIFEVRQTVFCSDATVTTTNPCRSL